MKHFGWLMAVALLAACGADGDPVRPKADTPAQTDGIRISGEARIGVVWVDG